MILVDTDVLIDVALDRTPYSAASGKLLDALEQRKGTGYVAWHSLSNFYYVVAPVKGASPTRVFIEELIHFIHLAPATKESVRFACQSPMKDFEDALQVAAAIACGATVIATRNLQDYVQAPIRAVHPATLIKELV